jgi:hypothetical protein
MGLMNFLLSFCSSFSEWVTSDDFLCFGFTMKKGGLRGFGVFGFVVEC